MRLPPEAVKTYALAAPLGTHFRPATCAEVDCPAYLYGWLTKVDEATDLGQAQAHYIRHESGRSFSARHEAGLTMFKFLPGQQCFAPVPDGAPPHKPHQQSLEREPIYLVREGDRRGNPRGTGPRVHTRPEDWVEDFGGHQQRLADRLERG